MITAFRQKVTIKRGGVINLRSQSLKEGEIAEVIVLVESVEKTTRKTAADLLASDLTGIWADREDLGDSLEFARSLRRQAEQRGNSQ